MRCIHVHFGITVLITILGCLDDSIVEGKELQSLTTYVREEHPNIHVNIRESLKDTNKTSTHHVVKRGFRIRRAVRRITRGVSRVVSKVVSTVGKVISKGVSFIGKIVCFFFCKGGPPPNNPPYFTSCSGPPDQIAPMGQTSVSVTWSVPSAVDREDGALIANLVQGNTHDSLFERGTHTIIYKASDKNGLTAYCHFTFKVSVIACDPIQWPINGFVRCDKPVYIYGSYCTIGCNQGYQMVSSVAVDPDRIMCDKTVDNKPILNKAIPTCKEITCAANSSALEPLNGAAVCTHSNHKYDSSCVTQCISGYSQTSGIIFSTCQEDTTWSTDLPDCKDSESPEISNCPSNVHTYTDKNSQATVVTWTEPTAIDNSGQATVSQSKGPMRGSSFRLGLTEVRYKATDAAGNTSPECIFFVNVEEIRCDPPVIADKYLFYQCPDGYSYGSTCELKCMGSFPLIGNDTITCERNDSYSPPRGYWNMGGTEPFCSKNPCDKLPAPENGAMVCDTWMFGMQCQMQCSGQYDIPYGTVSSNGAPFTGVFTCSESKGEYTPSNTVPGCTALRRPRRTTVLGDFFYYTGDCNDPTVLEEIKQNFIDQMNFLEKNGFGGVCPSQIDCNIKNTVVTCGAITGRKKRWIDNLLDFFVRKKRSTHEIRVEITMETTWFDFNSTSGATFYFLEEIQKKIFNEIKGSASAGNLTVRGLAPDISSFALGWSDPDCPVGHAIRWSTLTCVPCGPGTFLDNSDPNNLGCKDCPVGKYKEAAEDVSCTKCPVGTSTLYSGSRNSSDCIDICRPGEFSSTGLEPCHQCPISTYQEEEMSVNCTLCPPEKITDFSGTTGGNNCSYYDIQLKTPDDFITIDAPSSQQRSILLSSWILVPNDTASFTLFSSESANFKVNITYNDTLYITINSLHVTSAVAFHSNIWSHLAVQIDSSTQTAVVFQNGLRLQEIPLTSIITSGDTLIDSSSIITLGLNENSYSGYLISGYQVKLTVLSDMEVAQLAGECHAFESNSYISMDTIRNTVSGRNLMNTVTPSICDNVNQCSPSPCNGHPCKDGVNSYTCHCTDGYHGNNCQYRPDFCSKSPCKNGGTCSNAGSNFTCFCVSGFKGDRCQVEIVNGGWSEWTSFTECSVTCGGGVQSRSRVCNSPYPDSDGAQCDPSSANESQTCNMQPCPKCGALRRSFGNQLNCSVTDDGHDICSVTCNHGYTFVDGNDARSHYICGPNTTYTWDGQPPACGRAKSPRRISILSTISYDPEIPCSEASAAASKMKTKLESSLSCSLNGTCAVKVENPGCIPSAGRRKRSTSGEQTITLSQTFISGDNLNLEMFYSTDNLSEPLYNLLLGVYELEASAVEMNSSHSVLQFELNGVNYTSKAVSTSSLVDCPDGQGRSEALCADCPMGTYSQSSVCVLCPVGTYQDETEQTFCKACLSGFTTKYEGSKNESDCSEETSTTDKSTSQFTSTSAFSESTETTTSAQQTSVTMQVTTTASSQSTASISSTFSQTQDLNQYSTTPTSSQSQASISSPNVQTQDLNQYTTTSGSTQSPASILSTTSHIQDLNQYTNEDKEMDLLLVTAVPVLITFLIVFSTPDTFCITCKRQLGKFKYGQASLCTDTTSGISRPYALQNKT
ncbi:sushi, von Willebrand factor type A, EGF and pentraxin domain-containing protein 1-like [Saccostrea echinata]|uniref:sushi, von Willebrand factor type A, EGF and pentraxin domain-containing protein 1-like n=1 Tax=Saccostrea echinata TaxID=191078 RepID=UPI002A815980|nr:sushi, von Willebrand factor type A, EGF and pentraxin domain-containing protein 1-like [Saccostrea echinata]